MNKLFKLALTYCLCLSLVTSKSSLGEKLQPIVGDSSYRGNLR